MESTDQTWQDPYFQTREGAANTTAASMDMAFMDTDDIAERAVFPKRRSADVAVLVVQASVSDKSGMTYMGVDKKYFWRHAISPGLAYASGIQPYIYEVLEESLGFPGEAIGSVSPWPMLWRYNQPEPPDPLGVFPSNYRRKVLFAKKIRFRISELPRWKPKTIIGLRQFEEEDV